MRPLRALLASGLVLALCGASSPVLGSSSPPDLSGAAEPGSLPFDRELVTKESHIASPRHADSLLHSSRFDTTYARKSVLEAVARELDTRGFASVLDHALERDDQLADQLREQTLWTVFAPSNNALASLLAVDAGSSLSSIPGSWASSLLVMRHLVPAQSFVVFESNLPRIVRLPTLDPASHLFVCDMTERSECAEAARIYQPAGHASPSDVTDATHHLILLYSDIIVRNRVAGNGVVHVIDRVLLETPGKRGSGAAVVAGGSSSDPPASPGAEVPPSSVRLPDEAKDQLRGMNDTASETNVSSARTSNEESGHRREHEKERSHEGRHRHLEEVASRDDDSDTDRHRHPRFQFQLDLPIVHRPPADPSGPLPESLLPNLLVTTPEPSHPVDRAQATTAAPVDGQLPPAQTVASSAAARPQQVSRPGTWSGSTWIFLCAILACFGTLIIVGLAQRWCPIFWFRARHQFCCCLSRADDIDFEAFRGDDLLDKHQAADSRDHRDRADTRPLINEGLSYQATSGRRPPDL